MTGSRSSPPLGTFARRLLAVALVVIAALALWYLRHLLLLVFAAILLAVALRGLASLVSWASGSGNGWSFVVASLAAALAIALFFAILGTQLQAQLMQLRDQLPELLAPLERWIGGEDIGDWLAERAQDAMSGSSVVSRIAGLSGWAVTLLGNAVLVIVAALYIGHRPTLYRDGFLLLFPGRLRGAAARTLDALGTALRRWLMGQIASMLAVGTLTFLGLWALGIEAALALGFIAGILEFVPFVGPVLAIIPGLAVALSIDTTTTIWVLLLYLAIQQTEGNLLNPLIQQQAVALPPAVTLFALLAFGILFGPLGILLATPLAVVCLVTVKQVWLRETLGEAVPLPGKGTGSDAGEQGGSERGLRQKETLP